MVFVLRATVLRFYNMRSDFFLLQLSNIESSNNKLSLSPNEIAAYYLGSSYFKYVVINKKKSAI